MKKEWNLDEGLKTFNQPFLDLIYIAQTTHRKHFNQNYIQISTLLSIKTGSCPENCSYCPQSAHYNTNIKVEPLINIANVIASAKLAKEAGSTRFCMGAAWRGPRDSDLKLVCEMVNEVKKLGLETCATLGILQKHQAGMLKEAGLDFYNHNIDTSEEYYKQIITTRTFEDRLNTLEYVRNAGIKVCCGGILGMGETNEDRVKMLILLANLKEAPESVPINQLIKIPGTPLASAKDVDSIDFVRTIATARIMMPQSYVRFSAGRDQMSDELQTLCFVAGANSIFYGETLLTANNKEPMEDNALFQRLGLIKDKLKENQLG
jgi:biotin synthase